MKEIYAHTTANRLLAADALEGLTEEQWRSPTLCEGWDVHHMAAHLVQPMVLRFWVFFLVAIRYRGDSDRTVDHFTRGLARKSRGELIEMLREHAGDELDPPLVGPMGPFCDTCIHLRDIARPLGLDVDVPLEHWRLVLDYLVTDRAAAAFFPRGGIAGLRLEATDLGWSHGEGETVSGTAEAITMAITGRAVALDDLTGPGVATLRAR